MKKNTIVIDEEKCVGCGLCAAQCQHGVIVVVEGKAKLMRPDYCDALGECLPVCPMGAISFKEVEVEDCAHSQTEDLECGCPGSHAKEFNRVVPKEQPLGATACETHLNQWPCQLRLVAATAPYFNNAHLLISADCCAYAYGNFHQKFMKNRITLIGCPKFDEVDYAEKITAILKHNNIKSLTITRMEVPCCFGIETAAKTALQNCGKLIPWQIAVISTDGRIIEN